MLRLCLGVPRLTQISSRNLSNLAKNYQPIYKFPYINHISLINRLKLYYSGISLVILPSTSVLCYQFNYLTNDDLLFALIVALSGLIPLYSFGTLVNKFIGIIYTKQGTDDVKIAYVDFWGNRKDIIVKQNDIVPISELSRSFTDPLYLKFRQYSRKNTLKLCTNYGILDRDKFDRIFAKY